MPQKVVVKLPARRSFGSRVFFQLALVGGQAGPAAAIVNTNSVGVLALDLVFFHPPLPPLKLFGMALCIFGITVLSLAPRRKVSQARADGALLMQTR